ncbi:MAG: hypothetical protein KBD63_06740 [Bacteriovoracaceae bacterium]|nr:hypothetical protein [Bacteriovoracaceae bacterium]
MQKLNAKTAPTPEIPWIKIPADFKNNTSEKILKVEDFNYNESNSQITFNIINNHTKSMAGFIWVLLKNKNTLSFFPTQHNDFLISSYQQGLPFSMQKLRPVVAFFTDIHMPHPLARILIFSKTGDLILDETKEF